MGGNTESVSKPGIKFRSTSGSLRRPQEAPDCSVTKNRLSHVSGWFEPQSCLRHTDWVLGCLGTPGTKPRLTPGFLRHPEASSVILRPRWPILVLQNCIYKFRNVIVITFLGTQQDATSQDSFSNNLGLF